jgi:riboflavin synthase
MVFTGIIRHIGKVLAVRATAAGKRITIDLGPLAAGLAVGDSIAVSGPCLSACAVSGAQVQFDAVRETLSRTTLGRLAVGDKVNLERSLTLGQGLDGHLVQGHIDGLATVSRGTGVSPVRSGAGGDYLMQFSASSDLTDLMVPKGSVAIDGVSLTLVDVQADAFSVAIIPTTLRKTTLADLKPGDQANIETDVIGKYVRKYLRGLSGKSGGVTLDKLREEGFV